MSSQPIAMLAKSQKAKKPKSHKAGKVKSKKRNLNIKTNKKVGRE